VQEGVDALKKALESDDIEAVKSAQADLTTRSQKIGEALYAQQGDGAAGAAGAAGADASAEGASGSADEDVVDAEVVDDEDNK